MESLGKRMAKKVKVKTQIRIMKPDLKDMIRDELYGAGMKECTKIISGDDCVVKVVCIPVSEIKKIAKRIASRSIKGH